MTLAARPCNEGGETGNHAAALCWAMKARTRSMVAVVIGFPLSNRLTK